MREEALPSAASSIFLGSHQALRKDRMGHNPGELLPLPVPARIDAARAAPPVLGPILGRRNSIFVVFHWVYKGLSSALGQSSNLRFRNVFA